MSRSEQYREVVEEAKQILTDELPEKCIHCPIRGERLGPFIVADAFRHGLIERDEIASSTRGMIQDVRENCTTGSKTGGGDFPSDYCNFGVRY